MELPNVTYEALVMLYRSQSLIAKIERKCSCGMPYADHQCCRSCGAFLCRGGDYCGYCQKKMGPDPNGMRMLAVAVLKSGIRGKRGKPDWLWLRSADCDFWCDVAGVNQEWLLAKIEERGRVRAA